MQEFAVFFLCHPQTQNMTTPLTHILCLDVETTGQSPRTSDMLELAACVWEIGSQAPKDRKYYFFGFEDVKWCPVTWDEFWNNQDKGKDGKTPVQRLRERIRDDGVKATTIGEAAVDFMLWAREWYKRTDGKIIVLTDTSGFDYAFVSDMLARIVALPDKAEDKTLPLSLSYLMGKYQPVRDINSWYLGMGGTLQKYGARDLMVARLDIEWPDWVLKWDHDHNPQNDCAGIAAKAAYVLSLEQEKQPAKRPKLRK